MKMKKILSGALTLIMTLSLLASPLGGQGQEVHGAENHWATSYLDKLASQNILRGDQNGNFNPDNNITRAEFAAMLNRGFGFEQSTGQPFSDVDDTAWYADDISFASYQGYFQGQGGGTANPGGSLTREEAVTMLCRALKIDGEIVDTLQFADSRSFSSWSKGYINVAAQKGMLSGYPDGTFRPGNSITRGEVAKLLATVSGQIVGQPSQEYLGYVDGNVTLSKTGAGLRNTVISGDLYITEGVLEGYIFLDNVTVLGSIIISGAGESHTGGSSIVLTDCNINNIVVNVGHNKITSILTQGNTTIRNTTVKTNTYLEDGNSSGTGFSTVDLDGASGVKLDLAGDFKTVNVLGAGNLLNLNRGNIASLVAGETGLGSKIVLGKQTSVDEIFTDSRVDVSGDGAIHYVSIGTNGTVIKQMPEEIIIRPGVTASIGGKQMTYLDAEMENASPRVLSGYPEVKDITVNSATGLIKGNKPGTIYWVVKEEGDDAPDKEDMLDPKNAEGIVQSGNMSLALANIDAELSAKISGLKSGLSYELYVMLVDNKDNASRPTSSMTEFETLDKTAPQFLSGYPKGRAVYTEEGDHRLEFDIVPTKGSTVYWIIAPEKSTAPTPERLFAGNGMAAEVDHGTMSTPENQLATLIISDLEEDTNYDVYLGLKDSKSNVSGVSKITLRTKDVTAPEFEPAYPKMGTIGDKTIDIQFMTDENATIYWAVLARGSKFPPGAPANGIATTTSGAIVSYWSTDAAKDAVITGNSSLKSGNAKATAKTQGQFTISGLDADTAYDIYMVAADATGNKSYVGKIETATRSVTAPTARMVFAEGVSGGNPSVGTDVTIAFSKPVFALLDDVSTAFVQFPPEALEKHIFLYTTSQDGEQAPVAIDFTKVVLSEAPGYTTVTFSTTSAGQEDPDNATPAAIQLESGGRYHFELNGIMDMSGKALDDKPNATVKLDSFQMKAPFVSLRNTRSENMNYDILVEVAPKMKGASSDLMYNTVFETNKKIVFTLNTFTVDDDGNEVVIKSQSGLSMEPGNFYLESYLYQDKTGQNYNYIPFNDLTAQYYGLIIEAIEGNTDSNSWNGSVTVTASGVAGSRDTLDYLTSPGRESILADALKNSLALGAAIVSDPAQLQCIRYFEDMIPPTFSAGYPKFTPGDSSVGISVMTNKQATVYYLITPEGSIGSAAPPPMSQDQLINGTYRPEGSKWGTMQISNGNAVVTDYVRELQANTSYYVFYLARGTRPSEILVSKFTTVTVITPRFASAYPMAAGQGQNEAYVTARFVDASAEVYWAAYPVGQWSSGNAPSALQISGEMIDTTHTIIDSGSQVLMEGEVGTFTVKGLKEGQYYDFFITARNPLGDEFCEVKEVRAITPRDMSAPTVMSAITAITDYTDKAVPSFSGSVRVSFTKPLHYATSETATFGPLTDAVFKSELNTQGVEIKQLSTSTQSGSPGVNGFYFEFENVVANKTISFPHILGDGMNRSGYLQLTFVRNSEDLASSYWDVRFVDRLY